MLALALVEIVLPYFNGFLGKNLALQILGNWQFPLTLLGIVAVVGLLAGSYPAFYLSAFKPVQVLKNRMAAGGSALFRNTLVVLQFSIAIVLVVATLIVMQQMRFARSIELGFQKDQMLVLTGSPTAGLGPQWDTLRQELLKHPEVLGVTASGQTPLEDNGNSNGIIFEGEEEGRLMPVLRVDYDFFSTYAVPVLAGREFTQEYPGDRFMLAQAEGAAEQEYGVMLNRLAAQQLGWTPEEAVGKRIKGLAGSGERGGVIIGVVENSYFESVRSPVKPMLFYLPQRVNNGIANLALASVRLSGSNLQQTLIDINRLWQQLMPELPMERQFLAIFIACMGLYGLANFNAERRRKEVGIRKVMGSGVWSIVLLLTNDFSKLVLISNVIAWPVAYVAMNRWLENFAYRIDLTPVIFIGSGLIALCIAWVTVGSTAAKAASQKPVLALRYE